MVVLVLGYALFYYTMEKSYIFFNYEADSTYKLMTIVHYFESDAPLRYTHIQPFNLHPGF